MSSVVANNSGTRMTAQREAVFLAVQELARTKKLHPTADEVFEVLRADGKKVGLATVYRNLHKLAGEGVVREVSFEEGVVRYDARLDLHGHFVCERCESVSDFDISGKTCPAHFGAYAMGTVKRGRIDFYGICENCSE